MTKRKRILERVNDKKVEKDKNKYKRRNDNRSIKR